MFLISNYKRIKLKLDNKTNRKDEENLSKVQSKKQKRLIDLLYLMRNLHMEEIWNDSS